MRLSDTIIFEGSGFGTHGEATQRIEEACQTHSDISSCSILGKSEEGQSIIGVRLGSGKKKVSLIAGAHSDEPVGPETLRAIILQGLEKRDQLEAILSEFTLYVVPHVNPDGELKNRPWMSEWPSVESYIRHAFRELPGRDVEFNYPERRVENQIVSNWWRSEGPFSLHMSLHGMGFSDGAMLLIEKNWAYRTEGIQEEFSVAASSVGLRMHDHNRKGEKGFFHIAPGFTTTPEGSAMRTYFLSHDLPETAALFGDSSMEFVRSLGGDPLCLVTELPLFLVEGDSMPGDPTAYLEFKRELPEIRLKIQGGDDISGAITKFGLNPLPIGQAVFLQLRALELGLETV